tara:strand:- start:2267 stop:3157 length:891 start_codon:yes stop_codon:yes gene_type:complete
MTLHRKGIVLAGGTGSRLMPITNGISKQLMPVFDKPMIYYPLSTLMLADIREVLIITTPQDNNSFKRLLGDGSKWGMRFEYGIQEHPNGLAQAFLIGSKFLGNSSSVLILGDNIFHGNELITQLKTANKKNKGCTIFAYPVSDPERYGIVELDKTGTVLSIEEKPYEPKGRNAITGIYFYDNTVVERAKKIKPSKRGELEITSLNASYLKENNLNVELLGRGMAWLDTGTFDSLHQAGSYIRTLEARQGLKVGCPEEIAWRKGWINDSQLEELGYCLIKSGYGKYLLEILHDPTIF